MKQIAIIGCGLVGRKRSKVLNHAKLVAAVDTDLERAEALAKEHPDCLAYSDWRKALMRKDIDIVIVATTHANLSEISLVAIEQGKHVLVEKPAGRHSKELEPLIQASKHSQSLVRVGFNHRYHPSLIKARQLVDEGALGELMFLRARYGHGGRLGYEKEWRANPLLSGGGELIDQGVHLIDLARWFLGDFNDIQGLAQTCYWPMPVDDNGFLLLRNEKQQVAFLHASCTEWKNLFSFEIYGKTGKIDIQGLGGSYGLEKLTFYQMLPEMGPPLAESFEYPLQDDSWAVEFQEFLDDIEKARQPSANLHDALAALRIVEDIYRKSNYDHSP